MDPQSLELLRRILGETAKAVKEQVLMLSTLELKKGENKIYKKKQANNNNKNSRLMSNLDLFLEYA